MKRTFLIWAAFAACLAVGLGAMVWLGLTVIRLDRAREDARRAAALEERVRLARNAILTTEGLEHTSVRPSAWWLNLVDPSGTWYREVRRRTEFRLERLGEHG